MKHFLFPALLLLCFSPGFAQKKAPDYSYIITQKTIIAKNEKSPADDSCIYYIPVVSDKYPELKKALSDTSLFDGKGVDSAINEYKTTGEGYAAFSYGITYADKNVISLQFYYETTGDQPDESQRWLTLNIHTGKPYALGSEISSTGLNWILSNYKALVQSRISEEKAGLELTAPDNTLGENDKNIFDDLQRSVDNLDMETLLKNYVFTDKGIIFTTDDILPPAAHGREPDRNWLVPYKKLKPYILSNAIVLNK